LAHHSHLPGVGATLRWPRSSRDCLGPERLCYPYPDPSNYLVAKAFSRDPSRPGAQSDPSKSESLRFSGCVSVALDRRRYSWASDVDPADSAIVAEAVDYGRAGLSGPVEGWLLRNPQRGYLDDRTASQLPRIASRPGWPGSRRRYTSQWEAPAAAAQRGLSPHTGWEFISTHSPASPQIASGGLLNPRLVAGITCLLVVVLECVGQQGLRQDAAAVPLHPLGQLGRRLESRPMLCPSPCVRRT